MDNTDLIAKLRKLSSELDIPQIPSKQCQHGSAIEMRMAADALEVAKSEDPLQGAVDWFLQADREFFCVATVQRTLRIGYNRAQRLCETAKERAAINEKK